MAEFLKDTLTNNGNLNEKKNKNISGDPVSVPATGKKQSNADAEPKANLSEGPWSISAGKKGNGGFDTTSGWSKFSKLADNHTEFCNSKK